MGGCQTIIGTIMIIGIVLFAVCGVPLWHFWQNISPTSSSTNEPTNPPATPTPTPPSIVSFTVDNTNPSEGATITFTVTFSYGISPDSEYNFSVNYGDPDAVSACSKLPGCPVDSGSPNCNDTNTTCATTDSQSHPGTTRYQAIIWNGYQQVSTSQVISVTWS